MRSGRKTLFATTFYLLLLSVNYFVDQLIIEESDSSGSKREKNL